MNEMLPEERQIVKALNPWLRLSPPPTSPPPPWVSVTGTSSKVCVKSFAENNSESTKEERKERSETRGAHNSVK